MQTAEPRFLCIIASPRTGSDYLCALLGRIAGIRSRTEIFHGARAASLTANEIEAVGAAAQKTFHGPEDPGLGTWMRNHPATAVRAIYQASAEPPTRVLSFKVFPGQVPAQRIATRLIPMPRMRFLIVKRRIIDAYISLVKARLLERWGKVDTTNLRVILDPEQFVRYVENHRRWYETLSAEIASSGKPGPVLIYEEFTRLGEKTQIEQLSTTLRAMGFGGLAPSEPPTGSLPWKQDRSLSYEHKVMNWAQFVGDPRVRELPTDIFGYF